MTTQKIPTEEDAQRILYDKLGKRTKSIKRFPAGLANYVYDVVTEGGKHLVVRLTRPDLKYFFEGAIYWYSKLKDKKVPLPTLYYSELDENVNGFPVVIMDRLPGKDLNEIYLSLTQKQKKEIARQIATIQKNVASLPLGKGYGYARSADDPTLYKQWIEVLDSSLERSGNRIQELGAHSKNVVDRVRDAIHQEKEYFSTVKPTCFLDDTTTKNVIINEGKLEGIVDVDSVAFGDPLFTVALTRMSLLTNNYDTDYIKYWIEELHLNSHQKIALNLYTALFCVDFMSEIGQVFNKQEAEPIDKLRLNRLEAILDQLLK